MCEVAEKADGGDGTLTAIKFMSLVELVKKYRGVFNAYSTFRSTGYFNPNGSAVNRAVMARYNELVAIEGAKLAQKKAEQQLYYGFNQFEYIKQTGYHPSGRKATKQELDMVNSWWYGLLKGATEFNEVFATFYMTGLAYSAGQSATGRPKVEVLDADYVHSQPLKDVTPRASGSSGQSSGTLQIVGPNRQLALPTPAPQLRISSPMSTSLLPRPNNSQIFTTRVGRWMSSSEYQKMVETGKVQMSQNNMTHVANPADKNSFKAAEQGSLYVEFDVSNNYLSQGGQEGWGIIYFPGSIQDRLNQLKGLPPTKETPDAYNIKIVGEK